MLCRSSQTTKAVLFLSFVDELVDEGPNVFKTPRETWDSAILVRNVYISIVSHVLCHSLAQQEKDLHFYT